MSLYLDVDRVAMVLLADGWHAVVPGTFRIDLLEFRDALIEDARKAGANGGGESKVGDIVYDTETQMPRHGAAYGFTFVEDVKGVPDGCSPMVMGFLASILAARHAVDDEEAHR